VNKWVLAGELDWGVEELDQGHPQRASISAALKHLLGNLEIQEA
jgi:hypothetical protein